MATDQVIPINCCFGRESSALHISVLYFITMHPYMGVLERNTKKSTYKTGSIVFLDSVLE